MVCIDVMASHGSHGTKGASCVGGTAWDSVAPPRASAVTCGVAGKELIMTQIPHKLKIVIAIPVINSTG